jgi:homoserine dehydrogenase
MLSQQRSPSSKSGVSSSYWHPAKPKLGSIKTKSIQTTSERTPFVDRGKHKAFCNIAIVGFGTVGSSVARILSERAPDALRLTHICNRNVARKRVDWLPNEVQWTEEFNHILKSEADVIVELIGGLKPAEEWIRRALLAGKSVVTANKLVIAHCGPELLNVAKQRNCRLAFGAAVAGGVPVISAIQDGLAGDEISKISGVLNGTCNYILSEMGDSGTTFASALGQAQQRGYAEADSSEDIDGLDARAKLVILARIGLHANVSPTSISCSSISGIESVDFEAAKQLGCTIRQVSSVELQGDLMYAAVHPALVPFSSPLALTRGSQNVVICTGKFGGRTVFLGEGAGGNATAVAVVSDLLGIARKNNEFNDCSPCHGISPAVSDDIASRHYLRFSSLDKSRIIPYTTNLFQNSGINIDSVLEDPHNSPEAGVAITLHACKASVLKKALKRSVLQVRTKLPILN